MDPVVEGLDIELPDRSALARGAHLSRKPCATAVLALTGGDRRRIAVPVRLARTLDSDALGIPLPYDACLRAIFDLEDASAMSCLMDMLSRRDHSVEEARTKLLREGSRSAAVAAAVSRAIELGYLDDTRFASYFVSERLARGWGRIKIERALRAKGVDLDAICGYPDDFYDPASDVERARALIEGRSIPETRAFEKLVRRLMSKGFTYGVAADAVRAVLDGDDV